jgi:hypothetical protein
VSELLVVLPGLLGPSFRRCRVAPSRRDATLRDMPLVPFLDDAEGDIGKQGREDFFNAA